MFWLIRLFLLLMSIMYLLIGVWAILDTLLNAVDISAPSFMDIVGLSVSSEIGYSEIAGLYGGLNLGIGLMCLVGIFKEHIGIFAIKFITFLTGSIASGRVIFSMLPSTPSFLNSFFITEVCTCLVGIGLLKYLRDLNKST